MAIGTAPQSAPLLITSRYDEIRQVPIKDLRPVAHQEVMKGIRIRYLEELRISFALQIA